jgi:pimeloyl-ACP methyl ester carboxylesterase
MALIVAVALALAGCGRHDDKPQGTLVDADAGGGHRLHMLILGHGKPTVVLESGAQGGLGWELVRGPVSKFATVVTYDRAGHGQSPAGPQPRDARQVASELRQLIVAKRSGHNIQQEDPQIVVDAIREVFSRSTTAASAP